MASPDGWLFGRFGNRQSLNRAHQYIDRVPKSRDEKGFQFPMEWALRTARAARADVLLC